MTVLGLIHDCLVFLTSPSRSQRILL